MTARQRPKSRKRGFKAYNDKRRAAHGHSINRSQLAERKRRDEQRSAE